jgi:hypothetical protein
MSENSGHTGAGWSTGKRNDKDILLRLLQLCRDVDVKAKNGPTALKQLCERGGEGVHLLKCFVNELTPLMIYCAELVASLSLLSCISFAKTVLMQMHAMKTVRHR